MRACRPEHPISKATLGVWVSTRSAPYLARLTHLRSKRNLIMDPISRRQVVRGAAAAAVTLGEPSAHAQKDGQTMRFVAHADRRFSLRSGQPPTSRAITAILSTTGRTGASRPGVAQDRGL